LRQNTKWFVTTNVTNEVLQITTDSVLVVTADVEDYVVSGQLIVCDGTLFRVDSVFREYDLKESIYFFTATDLETGEQHVIMYGTGFLAVIEGIKVEELNQTNVDDEEVNYEELREDAEDKVW